MVKMGGRGFKKVTCAFMIIALVLLSTFPTVMAYASNLTVAGAEIPDGCGGGRWIRGVATWTSYETHFFEPGRLDLSANVIASLPLEEMELTYTWEIDGTVRTGRNTTIYIDNSIQSSVHIRLTVCSERSNSCAVDEDEIYLTNWLFVITVSSLFSILIIGMAFYEERWKKRLRSWI